MVLCLMNIVTKEELKDDGEGSVCVHEYMCVCAGAHEAARSV